MGLDDALDVWGVHGMGGWIGSILFLCWESYALFLCAVKTRAVIKVCCQKLTSW